MGDAKAGDMVRRRHDMAAHRRRSAPERIDDVHAPARRRINIRGLGPPYTPRTAKTFVRDISKTSPHAEAAELCRSREGRSVPLLHVREGQRSTEERFGVWVQARQHAWESGSSWVAQGFAEWIVSDDTDAAWLRTACSDLYRPCDGCRQHSNRQRR